MLLVMANITACTESNPWSPTAPLRMTTAIERRASLSLLMRTWEDRPDAVTDDNFWSERRFLDRSAFFGRKIRNTETYADACKFWMRCVREHVDRYDDKRYR